MCPQERQTCSFHIVKSRTEKERRDTNMMQDNVVCCPQFSLTQGKRGEVKEQEVPLAQVPEQL